MKKSDVIKFSSVILLRDTMVFERLFQPQLRLSYAEKSGLLYGECEWVVWMWVNEQLMGETYAVRLKNTSEDYEGCEGFTKDSTAYVYSTAILPAHQGKGYGTLLKAHLLGMLRNDKTLAYAVGHAYEGASIALCEKFGAKRIGEFKNWYKTGRSVFLYQQFLL